MLSYYINKVLDGSDLSAEEAAESIRMIMKGEADALQVASLLTALRMKKESVQEITGAASAMRQAAAFIDSGMQPVVDIVGTGGDSLGTFNISTTTSFVVAGAGVPVAKHGNRSVSSRSGAADVLAALGFNLDAPVSAMEHSIAENGIGFLFAAKFHPAMANVMPIRRKLGIRTIFNLLGPLTNPAGAARQLIGVYAPELTELFAGVLKELGSREAMVVHSSEGMDEISASGTTRVAHLKDGMIRTYELYPEMILGESYPFEDIIGGTPEENAVILTDILSGRDRSGRRAVTLMNAAAAIMVGGRSCDWTQAVKLAADSIDSGAAMEKLERLIEASKG